MSVEQQASAPAESSAPAAPKEGGESAFQAALSALEGQPPTDETKTPGEPEEGALVLGESKNQEGAPEVQQPQDSRANLYAKLTEQDKELRQLRSQLKDGGPALKDLAQRDLGAALQQLGIDIDSVIDYYANQPTHPLQEPETATEGGDPALLREVQQLKDELASMKKSAEQDRSSAAERHVLGEFEQTANAAPERYELINGLKDEGSLVLALQTARELYKLEGKIPDYSRVLDDVEAHLEETLIANHKKYSRFNKFSSKFQQTPPQEVVSGGAEKPELSPTLSTTNNETPVPREPTDEDRWARAMKALEQ